MYANLFRKKVYQKSFWKKGLSKIFLEKRFIKNLFGKKVYQKFDMIGSFRIITIRLLRINMNNRTLRILRKIGPDKDEDTSYF
jgi:hypothetical protein